MKVVIIGGVAGGASAAARLRRLDERAEIVVLERTGYMSYANCGCPITSAAPSATNRADAANAGELLCPLPRRRAAAAGGDCHHRAAKTVAVRPLDGGACYTECYDKLILAPARGRLCRGLPASTAPASIRCAR